MSNPPPRPALRKAPDAHAHPALPPVVAPAAPVAPPAAPVAPMAPGAPPVAPKARPLPAAVPVPPSSVPPSSATASPTPATGSASDTLRPRKAKKQKTPQESREHRKRHRDLAVPAKTDKEKTVVVEVPMPKSLRRRLDARAEELGYGREEAVLLLLRAWIDG